MAVDLVKENLRYEKLVGQNTADNVVKEEYIIPDTNPDVKEILMVDAKPVIVTKELTDDKVYMEGHINFNILYLAEINENREVFNVTYNAQFSNYLEVPGSKNNMKCTAKGYVEHIECKMINERKISVEGIINLRASVYTSCNIDFVKDIEGLSKTQTLKKPISIDKIAGELETDMIAKSQIVIPMNKPQIGTLLKCDVKLHKKTVNLLESKVQMQLFAHVKILYKGDGTRDIICVDDDVLVTKEDIIEGINSDMDAYSAFKVDATEFNIREDDLGENRILDIEAIIKANIKVMYKSEIEMLEDAYSPDTMFDIKRDNYEMNLIYGHSSNESIVKENLNFTDDMPMASEIIMSYGKAIITEQKVMEDKVTQEGIISVNVLYKSKNKDKYVWAREDEIPFECSIDVPGCRVGMDCNTTVNLESMEAEIEADTIGIKAIVSSEVYIKYNTSREVVVSITSKEGEKPEKKASITIYVVQTGDTLWKIAKKYYTTVDDLLNVNEFENPDSIKPGEKIIIPGRAVI